MSFALLSLLLVIPAHISAGGINMSKELETYKAEVHKNYSKFIDLPADYVFSSGKPVLPLPPVSTAVGGVMVIGAYPSAIFARGVPADNLKMPFDDTAYPGGVNKSAEELDKDYLAPLGLARSGCWITNLVKVFLFKKGHEQGGGEETRSGFDAYAKKSLPWLEKELSLGNPKLIITLGEEVAGIVTGTTGAKRVKLLDYKIRTIKLFGLEYKIVHMVHPGLLMRGNAKWVKIHQEGLRALRGKI